MNSYSFADGLPQTGFRFCHVVSQFIRNRLHVLTSTNARSPSCARGKYPETTPLGMQPTFMFSPAHTFLLASLHTWDTKASSTPPRSRPSIKPCFVACTASGEFSQIFSAQEIAVSTALPWGTTSFTLRVLREDGRATLEGKPTIVNGREPLRQSHACQVGASLRQVDGPRCEVDSEYLPER